MPNIYVYRLLSETRHADDMNISAQLARAMQDMGVVEFDHAGFQVVRDGDTSVTVYTYRRKQ